MVWSLTTLLELLEVRGRSWCIVELGSTGGFSVPSNDAIVFHAVIDGKARITGISDGTMVLSPGDVRIILSGRSHTVRTQPGNRADVLDFLRFDDQDIDTPAIFSIGSAPIMARILCARLRSEFPGDLRRAGGPPVLELRTSFWDRSVRAMFSDGGVGLLTRMAQLWLSAGLLRHPDCPVLYEDSSSHDPIAHAVKLTEANPAFDWSVAELAKRVGMSRSNFHTRFSLQLGRTPNEVITEQRMHLAAKLIGRSDLTIAEIGERVGYRSEPAFIHRFKQFHSVTPSKMRSKISKKPR